MKLSYFELLLLDYLRISHPDRIKDKEFIINRSNQATQVLSDEIKNGVNYFSAQETARYILFDGLIFSPFDLLKDILHNEFSNEFSEENIPEVALRLLPIVKDEFETYDLTDDFSVKPEYTILYNTLTGRLLNLLKNDLQ